MIEAARNYMALLVLFTIMSTVALTLMIGAWGLGWGIFGMVLLFMVSLMWGDGG